MSHAPTPAAGDAPAHGHEDPMSHVPPGSIWPLLIGLALIFASFGALILMLKDGLGFGHFGGGELFGKPWKPLFTLHDGVARISLAVGSFGLLAALMGWCHQIIREKPLSHDPMQQQQDLKQFILQFLGGEAAVFGAIFAYFYHRKIWTGGAFGPPHGMHFGGPTVAYATLILISSSITCEIAHRALEVGQRGLAKALLLGTIILGIVFLGFQGFEYGELYQAGFTPVSFGATPGLQSAASFAGLFYAGTGFHGLHVAIGIVMLFMVLFRLEVGHFKGHRNFAMIAASWYWHFVDIVWILLFITIYVVA